MKFLSESESRIVKEFVYHIEHGDKEHRDWLWEAAKNFCAGEPVPPVRGGKNKPDTTPIIPPAGFIADA